MQWHPVRAAVAVAFLAFVLQGCAALPLALIASPLLSAGGDVLVKTGTEYSASGTIYRTFPLPMEHVRWGVREAFVRTQVNVTRDDATSDSDQIVGETNGRTVTVELLPLTPVLTSMQLDVKRNLLASDKATASLLLSETEKVLQPQLGTTVASDESARR